MLHTITDTVAVAPTPTNITIALIQVLPAIIGAFASALVALGSIFAAYFAYKANARGDQNSKDIAASKEASKAGTVAVQQQIATVHEVAAGTLEKVNGLSDARDAATKERGDITTAAAVEAGELKERAAFAEGQHKGVVDEQKRNIEEQIRVANAKKDTPDSTIGSSVEKIADAAVKIAGVETKETK